ncbi:hypothetical protein RRF57_003811 [Xylaria bambusicola]|uniref:Uncharacterized protein n=1 Tax=Xylaria bambusicola TaxID=326684 RepID=A0AAN7UKV9_9PEZI
MFTDSVNNKFAFGSNAINIDFLRTFNEFRDNHWMVRRDVAGGLKFVFEVLLAANNRHSSARKYITRTYENGIANIFGKFLSFSHRSELLPGRLINSDAVQNFRELLSVFGLINILGVCP